MRTIKCHIWQSPSFDLPQPPDKSGQALPKRGACTSVDMHANLKSPPRGPESFREEGSNF